MRSAGRTTRESGLGSSVWSDDADRAFDVGRRLEAGMTFINCHNRAGMSLRVPFGGVKRSGFGREFGDEGIAEFTQTHALHLPGALRGHRSGSRATPTRPEAAGLTGQLAADGANVSFRRVRHGAFRQVRRTAASSGPSPGRRGDMVTPFR